MIIEIIDVTINGSVHMGINGLDLLGGDIHQHKHILNESQYEFKHTISQQP